MKASNVKVKVYSNEEAQQEAQTLRGYGYRKASDCYWYEIWEKNGWTVEVERDF